METANNKINDCTVIILSYNTLEITDICMSKAEIAAEYSEKILGNKTEIIVVDNCSSDGSVLMIEKKHPKIKLIAMKENVGVAKGNNLAMRKATTPFILLINSDTYLEKETLARSINYMNKNKNCDVLMCHLYNSQGIFIPYGGHLPTPFKAIRWLLGFESVPFIKNRINRIYCYNREFYEKGGIMEWSPTCFFFLRRKVYESTGGHDENMFFYMEDVEWCKRITDSGFDICYTPSFSATHLGGASSNNKNFVSQNKLRGQFNGMKYYFKVHYPRSKWLVYWFLEFGIKMRVIFYSLAGNYEQANAYKNAPK